MRFLCFLFLLVFAGAVVAFAIYNQQDVVLRFMDWSLTAPVAAVAGVAYGLGMLSGWTVVGIVRRSIRRVVERPIEREHAAMR